MCFRGVLGDQPDGTWPRYSVGSWGNGRKRVGYGSGRGGRSNRRGSRGYVPIRPFEFDDTLRTGRSVTTMKQKGQLVGKVDTYIAEMRAGQVLRAFNRDDPGIDGVVNERTNVKQEAELYEAQLW